MEPGIHSNHRRRMRDCFAAHGMNVFYDHEILEMLLYSTIARGDTNEIAHDLLALWRLPAVLDAPDKTLLSVKGMGAHSVLLLRFMRDLMRRYEIGSRQALETAPVFTREHDVFLFFANKLEDPNEPAALMACLDNRSRVLCWRRLPRYGDVLFKARDVADYALQNNASMVALFCNYAPQYRENFRELTYEDQMLKWVLNQISIHFPYHLFVKGGKIMQFLHMHRPDYMSELRAPDGSAPQEEDTP